MTRVRSSLEPASKIFDQAASSAFSQARARRFRSDFAAWSSGVASSLRPSARSRAEHAVL